MEIQKLISSTLVLWLITGQVNMKNRFFITIFLLFFTYFFVPNFSHASNILIETESTNYRIGDIVRFDLYINTSGSLINTIETQVNFDSNDLKFFDFGDSDSVINFWIEKKSLPNVINLSGIVPGGFASEKGNLISLYFETLSEGKKYLTVKDSVVFLNDGEGTEEKIPDSSFTILVSNEVNIDVKKGKNYIKDIYPPETFTPEISRSSSLFDNKWFLVFSTKDKDSGVSHYLIKESRYKPFLFFKKWANSESPYILKDQSKSSFIAIKAVDKAGNERIEKLYPEKSRPLIEQISIGIAFGLIGLLLMFILYKILKKISEMGD